MAKDIVDAENLLEEVKGKKFGISIQNIVAIVLILACRSHIQQIIRLGASRAAQTGQEILRRFRRIQLEEIDLLLRLCLCLGRDFLGLLVLLVTIVVQPLLPGLHALEEFLGLNDLGWLFWLACWAPLLAVL